MEEDTYTIEAIQWLTQASEQEWLLFVCSSNYDFNPDVTKWMATNEKCTRSVALALYWRLEPQYYCQFSVVEDTPEWAREIYTVVKTIEQLYLSRQYAEGEIEFDPKNDPAPIGDPALPGYDWTEEANTNTCIPEVMFNTVPGRQVDVVGLTDDWVEGLPPHIAQIVFPEG
ncbi:DUF4274 domain-containing protein [Deinococcus sp. YIM 134068]|uniref:DUF4274 domain-containing protein n=1 Tax=Deinococcus lichenicola TaxID=3118910 RepID=UPI002F9286C4